MVLGTVGATTEITMEGQLSATVSDGDL